MSTLDLAITLACLAHMGQLDKSGQPYILQPPRLMFKFTNESERIVSVLHYVVDDGELTFDELRSIGFPIPIVTAIDCLSRRSAESYEALILRLSSNELSRKVKIEDIKDNLDVTRLDSLRVPRKTYVLSPESLVSR